MEVSQMSVEIATALLATAVPAVANAVWEALGKGLKTRGVQQRSEKRTPQTIEEIQVEAKALSPSEERELTLDALAHAYDAANGLRAERLRQAQWTFNAALALAVVGVLIVFVGVGLLLFRDAVAPGALTAGIGAVTEVMSALLFRFNHETNNRLDEIGKTLSAIQAAQIAMTLIDKIEDPTKRDDAIREAAKDLRRGPNPALQPAGPV
jgi:hypothetical protein